MARGIDSIAMCDPIYLVCLCTSMSCTVCLSEADLNGYRCQQAKQWSPTFAMVVVEQLSAHTLSADGSYWPSGRLQATSVTNSIKYPCDSSPVLANAAQIDSPAVCQPQPHVPPIQLEP